MKKLLLPLLLVLFAAGGCTRRYVITLNNGGQITTRGRPQLKGNVYVFKDWSGQPSQVSAGRVTEVAPASMAKQGNSDFKFVPLK